MHLLALSDTHIPVRAPDLPATVWNAIEAADIVVHAGDWADVRLLDTLKCRARHLVGVVGNNDGRLLRERLPEVARVELAGVRLAVVHDTGPARGREQRLLNPGSPTDRRRQPHGSFLTARLDEGRLYDVELHRVPTPAQASRAQTRSRTRVQVLRPQAGQRIHDG